MTRFILWTLGMHRQDTCAARDRQCWLDCQPQPDPDRFGGHLKGQGNVSADREEVGWNELVGLRVLVEADMLAKQTHQLFSRQLCFQN